MTRRRVGMVREARRSPGEGNAPEGGGMPEPAESPECGRELLPLGAEALRPGDAEDEDGLRGDGGLVHGILLGESGAGLPRPGERDSPPAYTWEFAGCNKRFPTEVAIDSGARGGRCPPRSTAVATGARVSR